jgi:hypothetical protein
VNLFERIVLMSSPVAIPHAEGAHHRASDSEDASNSLDDGNAMPDESVELSAHTARALREFLSERERQIQQDKDNPFDENWGLSQVTDGSSEAVDAPGCEDGLVCMLFSLLYEMGSKIISLSCAVLVHTGNSPNSGKCCGASCGDVEAGGMRRMSIPVP